MLSDEMTTGSVRTSDDDKRTFARLSHAHNLKNPKFRTIFPDHSGPELVDLPNMGQFDIGKPDGPPLPKNLGNPDGRAEGTATSVGAASVTGGTAIASSGSSADSTKS